MTVNYMLAVCIVLSLNLCGMHCMYVGVMRVYTHSQSQCMHARWQPMFNHQICMRACRLVEVAVAVFGIGFLTHEDAVVELVYHW